MQKAPTTKASDMRGNLPFKLKILMIAILPIILASALTSWVIHIGANRLIEIETSLIEQRILTFRQKELENYASLALTAIDHEYSHAQVPSQDAKQAVIRILNNLNYGNDGYFFAYDRSGTSLVNAPTPELIGANLWYIKDKDGKFIIQGLMKQAINGGGFFTYRWNKPSTKTETQKLSYATYLPKWGWMLGTGLYLDDIEQQVVAFRSDMLKEIRKAETVLFLVALLAVVVTAIAIAAVNYNEHKLADVRLKALTRRIVDVQEEERKRVSHDLHDGINQLLVSVRHRVELAREQLGDPVKAKQLLTKSMAILDTSIADVRRMSKALHPSALDNIGLAVAVRELAKDFEESTRITTRVKTDPIGDRIEETAKIAIYRVLQEALTNIARHSKASHVDISLTIDDTLNKVTLQIADNGIGLKNPDQVPHPDGLGLRNMAERMESHGGTMSIRNGNHGGVELIAHMPQI
ncbi:cache domain-containing protein [Cohaesibacter intestini]|uniref:cache domain-containing protein n=1 Tax=Cohaesibacter intestini TaxID=2211145 RepID=UPI000DE86E75|nr:cache domain-containing protein [Cohaesibacter intestini]